jgi:hypothetical protein
MQEPAPSPPDKQRCAETFEAIDPFIDDELYAVDPVPPDDDDAPA